MVIKTRDDGGSKLQELDSLLARPGLTKLQREAIEDEIFNVKSGIRGEKEAAYHIDFHLKDSKTYAVIHDLRIEHNGRVAQIDHLVIGRTLDLFLIESKNYSTALRVSGEGEFQVKTRYGWRGISSPVEQNKRHLRVLDELIKDDDLAPTRLGLRLSPTYHQWVLVPPECNVLGKRDSVEIIKMDMFAKRMNDWANEIKLSEVLSVVKIVSGETVMEFARKLADMHQPETRDFAAKFGISPVNSTTAEESRSAKQPEAEICEQCSTPVELKVVKFCRQNKERFGGRILCRECQKSPAKGATCSECGASVDSKVVAYCRFNSKRFGKRVLCRTCQGAIVAV